MDNAEIAGRLELLGALLERAGANEYTSRAYRRAADSIRDAPVPVQELVAGGRVRRLRGIGPGIEARLHELLETGTIAELDELQSEHGTTRVRRRRRQPRGEGLLLNRATELVEAIAAALGGEAAGDVRRRRDWCGQLTVVCAAEDPQPLLDRFVDLPQVLALIDRRERTAAVMTAEGVPVGLVVAEPRRFGTTLLRATGSADYTAALEPLPDAPDEHALYRALGIPWCPPELREQPFRDEPPPLLELADIRGDLHSHTTWSDGRASVEEMGRAALERGYDYLAICDHTPAVGAVHGLSPDEVRRQAEEIAAANEALAPFRVLRGIECDILPDGRLDLPDDVLAELDWVQASVHGGQRMPEREMTARVLSALRNPHVRCLSHPKGRYINRRPENALDLARVFEVCIEEDVAVEVNGLPDRLDLSGEHVRDALAAGVKLTCSTDAHSIRGLANMQWAVATARRGGATAADVLNTRGSAPAPKRG